MAAKDEKTNEARSAIVVVEKKQKVPILNLDTMEESTILLVYKEFSVNGEIPAPEALKHALKLVPVEKQAAALCKFAGSESYQAAKALELTKGNYMSSALRSALTDIMSRIEMFANSKAADNFSYWQDAYKDKANPDRQAKAKKLLDKAKMLVDTDDSGF